jgi:hypothetical protein
MAQAPRDTHRGVPIQVIVKLHDSPKGEKPPPAMVYAFTGSGHFITKTTVDGQGAATLTVPALQSAREIRIVAGPEVAGETPDLSELSRRGAKERFVRIDPEGTVSPVEIEIPSEIWLCWIRLCFVNGTLLKRVISGGLPVDLPVCNAEVQIWEVEPIEIIIAKLPDLGIEKLRRIIIDPPPPPENGIVPVGPSPPDPTIAMRAVGGMRLQTAAPLATLDTRVVQNSSGFADLQFAARHTDTVSLRQTLVANAALIRFWICEFFPIWVTKTLVATAATDRCGEFQAFVFLSCFSPNPNLYFTATVSFFGFPIYIYDPTPVACYTHWNYQCGSEVTLYTSSVFAPCCSPCRPVHAPENYVLVRAIGNTELNAIYGTSTTLTATGTNIGLAANWGDAPFGGLLLPRVEFDSSLRDFGRALYYRIRYRFGTTGGFTDLTGQIDRHYNHFVGTDLVTTPYNLGPKTIGSTPNLFEIPPSLPPVGDWAFPNLVFDLANAQFPTTDLPPPAPAGGTHGLYQLELALFDASGNPVDIATVGIHYFVPTTTDPDGTIHTADASTLGLVSGNSFIMTLHIDNRPTSGSLSNPSAGGSAADACGVLRYTETGATVRMPYTATHPDNFATYSWQLSRGGSPILSSSGAVGAATDPGEINASVSSLLGSCTIAGFAEVLFVWALATDGWSRLSQYDSGPQFLTSSPQYIAPVGLVLAPS